MRRNSTCPHCAVITMASVSALDRSSQQFNWKYFRRSTCFAFWRYFFVAKLSILKSKLSELLSGKFWGSINSRSRRQRGCAVNYFTELVQRIFKCYNVRNNSLTPSKELNAFPWHCMYRSYELLKMVRFCPSCRWPIYVTVADSWAKELRSVSEPFTLRTLS